MAFIALLSVALPARPDDISAGGILLDRASAIYPLTIQNAMWLLFFAGLGDVGVRFLRGGHELRQMRRAVLPEDEETMLRAKDLAPIYAQVRPSPLAETFFLQRLVARIVLQFQGSRSIDQSHALLNSSLELFQHEIDLKYNMLRYLMWLIPTLGFIGTVVGIALAAWRSGQHAEPRAGRRARRLDEDPHRQPGACLQHHAAGAGALRRDGVPHAPGAGPGGSRSQPRRAVLPGQPHQPPLRTERIAGAAR